MATSIVNKLRDEEQKLFIANKKLEEQDKIKSKYVQTVTHDILSPLSAIQACLNVVLGGLTGPISEKSKEMIDRANQRSQSLLKFAEELLDLSSRRIEKVIPKRSINLAFSIQKVLESLKINVLGKKIDVQFNDMLDDSFVIGNSDSIERLLENLMSNAIRYTEPGGRISVFMEDDGTNVQVQIQDTGIGIPKDDVPNVFKDFYRAKNGKKIVKQGTGLGLSIARQIVTDHNGEIWVKSEINKGTNFYFYLPKS